MCVPPPTLSVPACECDKLREMSFYIFGISVPSESQRSCHLFPITLSNFMQLNETMQTISAFFFSCSVHEFTGAGASIVRTPVWWIVIEGDLPQFWHIGNAKSAVFISADGSPITFSCPCHLPSHCCCNIICTAEGTHCHIVVPFHNYANYMLPLHSSACSKQHGLVYAFMSAGISKSTNLTDRDITSECPFPFIFFMNVKQLSVAVKAGYDL